MIFGLLTAANALVRKALSGVPVAGWLVSFFLGMYALMVSARLIGLFYRDNSGILEIQALSVSLCSPVGCAKFLLHTLRGWFQ